MTRFSFPPCGIAELLEELERQPHTDGPAPTRKPRMKRMSIAEQTLNKQVDILKAQYKDLVVAHNNIGIEMRTVSHMINSMEADIFQLERTRKAASTKSKP